MRVSWTMNAFHCSITFRSRVAYATRTCVKFIKYKYWKIQWIDDVIQVILFVRILFKVHASTSNRQFIAKENIQVWQRQFCICIEINLINASAPWAFQFQFLLTVANENHKQKPGKKIFQTNEKKVEFVRWIIAKFMKCENHKKCTFSPTQKKNNNENV